MTALNTPAARNAVAAQPRPPFAPLYTTPIDATSDPQARLSHREARQLVCEIRTWARQFNAPDAKALGVPRQWAMPARMLSSDGGEYRGMLLNMGLRIATAPMARNRLTERTTRREQLTMQLRTLEEKEEELICEAELAHLPIYRRADADPAVVLAYDPDGDMGAQGARLVSVSSSAPTSNPAAP